MGASAVYGAAMAGLRGQKSRLPECMEAILSCWGASYGERRHGRYKPSSDHGQHCGLETAITAS